MIHPPAQFFACFTGWFHGRGRWIENTVIQWINRVAGPHGIPDHPGGKDGKGNRDKYKRIANGFCGVDPFLLIHCVYGIDKWNKQAEKKESGKSIVLCAKRQSAKYGT